MLGIYKDIEMWRKINRICLIFVDILFFVGIYKRIRNYFIVLMIGVRSSIYIYFWV